MSGSGSSEALAEQLLARVRELESMVARQQQVIAEQADRIAELQRRVGRDSSTSSRPPSADAPWDKKPAKKRSSRSRSGRKQGKQPGSTSVSRSLAEDPDETFEVTPDRCARCAEPLEDAAEAARVRRQVVDVDSPPPPKVTEYQLVSRRCGGCGHVSGPTATDVPRPVTDPGSDGQCRATSAPDQVGACEPAGPESAGPGVASDPGMALALRPGSPVWIGPQASALAALLVLFRYRNNTNNCAERAVRPVKVQQRTSGGCWRTIQGLIDFALVHSYLDTATKWGINKLHALRQLFTTGAWLPPALTPS